MGRPNTRSVTPPFADHNLVNSLYRRRPNSANEFLNFPGIRAVSSADPGKHPVSNRENEEVGNWLLARTECIHHVTQEPILSKNFSMPPDRFRRRRR